MSAWEDDAGMAGDHLASLTPGEALRALDPSYRCPECADAGELHGQWADDGTEFFYVCAVCSGAFSESEVEADG